MEGETMCARCGIWTCRRLIYWYNHIMLLLLFSALVSHFGAIGEEGTCPAGASTQHFFPSLATEEGEEGAEEDAVSIRRGITYQLPPAALFAAGGLLVAIGSAMLIWGIRFRRLVTGVLIVGALAVMAKSIATANLLGDDPPFSLAAVISVERDTVSLGGIRLDLECTGSILAIVCAISLGIHALASPIFQRVLAFIEGAACAILAVRLLADFVPILLEPHPFEGEAHYFLGYPLVPFWLTAGPLALLIGLLPAYASVEIVTTALLGAFAAAKGARVLQHALAGGHSLELAGGENISSDMITGGTQLALFVVGVWLRCVCCAPPRDEHEPANACFGGMCGCCGCCDWDPEVAYVQAPTETFHRGNSVGGLGSPPGTPAPAPYPAHIAGTRRTSMQPAGQQSYSAML